MNEHIQFLQAFLQNPLDVGAVVPSSEDLAMQMCEGINANKDNIILELGVGTGAVTKFLQYFVPDAKSYLGIEINARFVKSLKKNFPSYYFACDTAEDAFEVHQKSGLGDVRYIISGLPFATLSSEMGEGILAEVDKFMRKGCMFRTFQYQHAAFLPAAVKFRKMMNSRYGKVRKSPIVWGNLPPAVTLTWETERE